ncbi:hypothetical protein V9T40_014406 [Parthenolecanium corni]|uniref:ABC1 atypical kinase-like domain-containing protein n=1 Tax=Parthenolecanium corni TaxID=536013 RepID=A0AAN9XY87_9HEMI
MRSFIKLSVITSVPCVPAFYYYTLSDQDKRLARVTVNGFERFFRSARIGILISSDYWWSFRNIEYDNPEYFNIARAVHQRSAERILHGCLKNGGLYIKLGQGLVNMDHVLPKEYIQTLKVLQDRCLQRKNNELVQLFEEEFGKSYTDMFESFTEEPIAAASLAQVFKAKRKDGVEVAVKVQYIDLRDRFNGDINTVKYLLKFSGWLFPKYDFSWIIKELETPLELELDFLAEARNAEKCSRDLSHLDYAYVPKVFWDQSSHRVLTTEFIYGVKISDVEKLAEENYSLVDVDTKLFTIFAEQIFHSGFIHADPHPGNLLVRKLKNGSAEIVILDHGLYETLPDNFRLSLSHLWKAVIMNNHTDMKKFSHQLGIADKDYRLFCIALVQKYVPTEKNETEDIMQMFFKPRVPSVRSPFADLSEEERNKFKVEAAKIHDRLINVFKQLPGKLVLVCRNLNAIRAIAKIHGNVVDRHSVMAHCATRNLFHQKDMNFLLRLQQRILFELSLWYDSFKRFLLGYILRWFRFNALADALA